MMNYYRDEIKGTWGTCNWVLKRNGVLTIKEGQGVTIYDREYPEVPESPWYNYRADIEYIRAEGHVVLPEDSGWLFSHLFNVRYIDTKNFDTSHVKNMRNMFYMSGLTSLRPEFDTSHVQDMSRMFCMCYNLKRLDLSRFDTSHAEDMFAMFSACEALQSLDISSFDVKNVRDMRGMFRLCRPQELHIFDFDVDCVTPENKDEWVEEMFS